ncbi:MAG: CHAT domain-containing protein [Gomphosphaeria aponina SAG 52.96 = DSM 107014]|uniref:CHAT domain-containing protein n=1 Tax=Gomphosphaeria aponina SAG 52.96 = DSM 107014 TaxID=1521640 RepID=A0A941GSL0_9CHRO|nr:CHAT domain-containing protein [Gomphosphaeria aponina SAG 52.96 = DSM 107014]
MKRNKNKFSKKVGEILRKSTQLTLVLLGMVSCLLVTTVIPTIGKTVPVMVVQETREGAALLAAGRGYYESGRYAEAVAAWTEAVAGFEREGDRLNTAQTLSYLSLAYQEMGQWELGEKSITTSLEILQETPDSTAVLAQAINTRGSLELSTGKTETALNSWKQAEEIYTQLGDKTGVLGSQINQAQALQNLGLYRRAAQMLDQVNQQLVSEPDEEVKATSLRSLGVALQVVGDLEKSQEILEQSLAISQELNLNKNISATLFSLGNTTKALGDKEAALAYYQEAAATAPSTLGKVEAKLNELTLLIETESWEEVERLLPEIEAKIAELSTSRGAVYARVNLAESLLKYGKKTNQNKQEETAQILAKAVEQAKALKDQRAESYALGTLGKVYEENQQLTEAQQLTEQALQIAQGINATDITYQWQWQLGRILKAQGDMQGAIAAETEAVKNLQAIKNDLVAINPDVQFSFQETVEPVYRNLVALLLTPIDGEVSQENLQQAREVIESLQLAELDNFFREACLNADPKQIDAIDNQAAVVYPIVLPDRLAVILSLPGKPLRYYETSISQSEVESTLAELLKYINPYLSNKTRISLSERVYDWIIRPAEADFAANGIKTLVFVNDGVLRNLPMSALYDGNQYLIEKYSVALTPGLQLLAPKAFNTDAITAVTAGVSLGTQGFIPLPGVEKELNNIGDFIVTGNVLLNQDFTQERLETEISQTDSQVVHLATHGQFSSNPEDTFVITWNDKIQVRDFQNLLQVREIGESSPIELLVLSACQTAAGDKRAALGLAGMAVRSGARSTLATLWSVNDESTAALITRFYEELGKAENENKAEALRQAQLSLLNSSDYKHPFYWSPFVLVGNWL